MRPSALVVFAMAVTLAAGCVHRARTAGDTWQLRGAVVSASETRLQVRHKSGQVIDLQIDAGTAFVRDNQTESWHALGRDTRVTVDVETLDCGVNRARRVQIFGG